MVRPTIASAARTRDDGDAFRFCSTCAFSEACLAEGMDKTALKDLHVIVEHVGPVRPGTHLFREREPFEAISAVRSGTVKTYVVDRDGREQVLGFHFPGEIIGLNAIDRDRYPCNAVAIDEVELCRFAFSAIEVLARRVPRLQHHLFRLLSRDIGTARLLAGDHSADERLAAFLLVVSDRLKAQGFPPDRFRLSMARTDIANYLRLAPETVSRVFRRLKDEGLIRVRGRDIELKDASRLDNLASSILRTGRPVPA